MAGLGHAGRRSVAGSLGTTTVPASLRAGRKQTRKTGPHYTSGRLCAADASREASAGFGRRRRDLSGKTKRRTRKNSARDSWHHRTSANGGGSGESPGQGHLRGGGVRLPSRRASAFRLTPGPLMGRWAFLPTEDEDCHSRRMARGMCSLEACLTLVQGPSCSHGRVSQEDKQRPSFVHGARSSAHDPAKRVGWGGLLQSTGCCAMAFLSVVAVFLSTNPARQACYHP